MAEQQAKELFAVVKDYQSLEISDTTLHEKFHATYEGAMEAILSLKEKFKDSRLFGVEKDKYFHSSIGQSRITHSQRHLHLWSLDQVH